MSKTFDIVCLDCKIGLWIGQQGFSEQSQPYIYKSDLHLKCLEHFLYSHQFHNLQFGEGQFLDKYDYRSFDNEEYAEENGLYERK